MPLDITLSPGEGTGGTEEKELSKEEESKLSGNDYVYDNPSNYLEATFAEPPPSYSTFTSNFNQEAPASTVSSRPSPMSNETQHTSLAVPNEYETLPSLPLGAMPTSTWDPAAPQSPTEQSDTAADPYSQAPVVDTS